MIRFGLFLSYSGGARTAGGRGGVSTVGRSDGLYDCISELSISVRASRSSEPVSERVSVSTFVYMYRHANDISNANRLAGAMSAPPAKKRLTWSRRAIWLLRGRVAIWLRGSVNSVFFPKFVLSPDLSPLSPG